MGTIDDDGVGVGDIDAVLHDGGREQHVVVVVREVEHYLLELLGLHLSVTNGDAAVGDVLMNHLGNLVQLVDAVIDEIDLSVAAHLEVDGIGDDLCREGMYLCLNGIAVGWRRLDDTQVAGAHQRELQGAGNRRSTHGEGIDIGLHLAQFFFCRDAKLLFLVDNQQS